MNPSVSNLSAADELRWIDAELVRVDQARAWLLRRRAELLAQAPVPVPSPMPRVTPPEPARPKAELSGRAVARLLLVAGAVLVVIAAAAFTVANWSSIGARGRAGVLLGVTAITLLVPVPLTRRSLQATAESVAAIGLALTMGDAYLIGRLLHVGSGDWMLGVAAATGALALVWFGYGRVTKLRGPVFAAIVMAQLPGIFLTARASGPMAFSLMMTAGADLVVASLVLRRHQSVARALTLMGAMTWLAGVTLASLQATVVATLPAADWLAATAAVAAIVGIAAWPKGAVPEPSVVPVAAVSGVVLTGIAAPVALVLPTGWRVVAFAAAGSGVAAGMLALRRLSSDGAMRLDAVASGATVTLGVTGWLVLPGALLTVGAEAGWPALIVLTLLATACWFAPTSHVAPKCAAIVIGALALTALPAAVNATLTVRLAILTAAEAALAIWSARRQQDAGRALTATAIVTAAALGASAAVWSHGALPLAAALAAVFTIAAALARNNVTAAIATGAALAAATLLAYPHPAAIMGVATVAIGVATPIRRRRPVHALVLDACAGPVVVLAAIVASRRSDTFSEVAVVAALLASTTSWLRTGTRRVIALAATGGAVIAAVGAQWRPLTAWSATAPWQGHPLVGTEASVGLPFSVGVLAVGLVAVVTAFGAARGSTRGSLDAFAIALPIVAGPALLAGGLSYAPALACLLALALALTIWAMLGSVAPAAGAAVATCLALAWALAAPVPTLIAVGCLAATYLICALAPIKGRIPAAFLSVLAIAGLAAAAVLAASRPGWAAGLAMLAVAVGALCTADQVRNAGGLTVVAMGWAMDFAAWPVAVAGLVVFEVSWIGWLAARGVGAIEAYTMPVAVALIAYGWYLSRRELISWLTFGPGLVLLLVPSLVATWNGTGWIRPAALGVAAAAVTLIGARAKLQAPILIGATVAAIDGGYQIAQTRISEVTPGWVPIAVIGAVLLWTGATYEARLRNLASLRRALANLS